MGDAYYSNDVVKRYLKDKLCQGDKKLWRHYKDGDVAAFRERLTRKYDTPQADANIEHVVYTAVTDAIRPALIDAVGRLTDAMKPWGDLILSGGDAFNAYFDPAGRIVTSDIDTKFVPRFAVNDKFFGNLQACKLVMWHAMGKLARDANRRAAFDVADTPVGRMLGVKPKSATDAYRRRYVLLPKTKQGGVRPVAGDVLIDVEVMALDARVRHYVPSRGAVLDANLGMLDVAIMRPGELGHEATGVRVAGFPANVRVASKRFLVEDLYVMKRLKLRPSKAVKDRARMVAFARDIVGVPATMRTPDVDIVRMVRRALPPAPKAVRRARVTDAMVAAAGRLNQKQFDAITTRLSHKKHRQLSTGRIVRPGAPAPKGYTPVAGDWRFDADGMRWVRDAQAAYVHNEMTHRTRGVARVGAATGACALYGYKTSRDAWVPRAVIDKARAMLKG